jgi:hypothetical protein
MLIAYATSFGGLDRIELVIDWGGDIVNFVHFHIQGEGHVVPNELESGIVHERW